MMIRKCQKPLFRLHPTAWPGLSHQVQFGCMPGDGCRKVVNSPAILIAYAEMPDQLGKSAQVAFVVQIRRALISMCRHQQHWSFGCLSADGFKPEVQSSLLDLRTGIPHLQVERAPGE